MASTTKEAKRATRALDRARSVQEKASATAEQLSHILGDAAAGGASLVTQPMAGAGVPAGSPVGVSADGASPIPPEGEPGFLATWWPMLLGVAAGALAFFYFDLGIWWSLGIALAATVALNLGRMFLSGG